MAERALRCGMVCRLVDTGASEVRAVETLPGDWRAKGTEHLVLTGWRLASLGLEVDRTGVFAFPVSQGTDGGLLRALADPTRGGPESLPFDREGLVPAGRGERAAIELCKLAALLPAALVEPASSVDAYSVPEADVVSVFAYRDWVARSVVPVVEAEIPLEMAERARFVAFRPADGGIEQYAIVIGEAERQKAPLCRLHSECFTGDLFGSLRCDCGEQLNGAMRRMAEEGGGVLLYLRQEGRGIGLVNKLRAYRLQEEGLDTLEANMHLGFEPDERDFLVAATMLEQLGFPRIRLLTNNPLKMEALIRQGIEIAERVPHSFAANRHNRFYLETKARKSGHLIDLEILRGRLSRRRDRA